MAYEATELPTALPRDVRPGFRSDDLASALIAPTFILGNLIGGLTVSAIKFCMAYFAFFGKARSTPSCHISRIILPVVV